MRISDWSSVVCSSDLQSSDWLRAPTPSASVNWIRFSGSRLHRPPLNRLASGPPGMGGNVGCFLWRGKGNNPARLVLLILGEAANETDKTGLPRSEEHTSELQSLMRISYAVFCLENKKSK